MIFYDETFRMHVHFHHYIFDTGQDKISLVTFLKFQSLTVLHHRLYRHSTSILLLYNDFIEGNQSAPIQFNFQRSIKFWNRFFSLHRE